MKSPLLIAFLAISSTLCLHAQQKIKDGTGTPATSLPAAGSILELQSTQGGIRFPQVSLTSTVAWAPLLGSGTAATSPGMTVYNTNSSITGGIGTNSTTYPAAGIGEYYWDGFGWVTKNAGTAQNTEVVLRVEYSGTQTVVGGQQKVNFISAKFDKGSNFNLATDQFTAPSTGYYLINFNINCTTVAGVATGRFGFLYVNGVLDRTLFNEAVPAGAGYCRSAPALLKLVAGDIVRIDVGSASAATWDFTSSILEITKLSN